VPVLAPAPRCTSSRLLLLHLHLLLRLLQLCRLLLPHPPPLPASGGSPQSVVAARRVHRAAWPPSTMPLIPQQQLLQLPALVQAMQRQTLQQAPPSCCQRQHQCPGRHLSGSWGGGGGGGSSSNACSA
jgi:hypothetical protein